MADPGSHCIAILAQADSVSGNPLAALADWPGAFCSDLRLAGVACRTSSGGILRSGLRTLSRLCHPAVTAKPSTKDNLHFLWPQPVWAM